MLFPISIILQQALALFTYKSDAGIKFFTWWKIAVADFETMAIEASSFLVDPETAEKGWFIITTVSDR